MSKSIVTVDRAGAIAVIRVDSPPVNTIDARVRAGLAEALTGLEAARDVKAVLLICVGSTFFSGADINEFSGPPKEEEYRRLFARLESLPVPVVAAMHGTVLGGGLELSLACHYRVAAPRTRFGFPEVTLGIIPGAGGTQRMPRLIGVEKTLELVLSGRPVEIDAALGLGFVDARGAGAMRTRPLRKVDAATATTEILERARAQARKQYPHREAALTAIEAIGASARLPLAEGLLFEEQLANRSKATVEAKASIHVFFAERATRKIPGLSADAAARPIRKAGVIGAGTMGGGIAICFANAGIPVTIVDSGADSLARGLGVVDKTYESMVKRGRLTAEDKATRLALIGGTLDYAALADADVVVEAVFEDMALKKRIFAELERVTKPGTILGTNTSSLDVAEIAAATTRPGDVIGLHFFSPANVMPLLEVIRTESTSPTTIRTAMDLSRPLKKTPVLAKVCYGFVGNRMMEGYAREALRIVLEGATPRQVDSALEDWGMAMGILAVFDMAGIDVGVKVHAANADKYPPDPAYYAADQALYAAGRLGQKNGKGFYRYVPGDRARHDDEEALAIVRARAAELGIASRTHTDAEIVARCVYPILNEGFKILEEGIVLRAADIDVVWTSGYGFPRWRGGPMFYAETLGLKALYEGILRFRAEFGPMHWQPAGLLEELARSGSSLKEWESRRATGVA